MTRGGTDPVPLHADEGARSATVGGADGDRVHRDVTAAVASLVGDPPALLLTGSCTAALEATAALLDLRPGDEVVVPAFTFPTTASVFAARGATIRFADVDPATGSVDADTVAACVGARTRAVVVVHYAGIAVDPAAVRAVLAGDDVDLVEDAAHGVFASWEGVPLGRHGRFGALSFHHTKNLSTGEGGALVVNDDADVERALIAVDKGTNRSAFDRGLVDAYEWAGPGSAWRMPEAAVSLLAGELGPAEGRQRRRHRVWDAYQEALAPWAANVGAGLPVVPAGAAHPAHLYFVVLPPGTDRATVVGRWAERGVQAARHYGSLPLSSYGRTIAHPDDRCPGAAELGERLVRIPLHHRLDEGDVERVIDVVTSTPLG